LQAITILCLFTDHIEHGIDELCTLGVMAFSPVVSGSRLAENEVVRPEDLAVGSGPDAVHGSGLKIHENSPRHVPPTVCLIVVYINPFELKIGSALVHPRRVYTVLRTHHLPELASDLVPTLPPLDVKDLSHFQQFFSKKREREREREMNGEDVGTEEGFSYIELYLGYLNEKREGFGLN